MGEYADMAWDATDPECWSAREPPALRTRWCRKCGKGRLHWTMLGDDDEDELWRLAECDGSIHVCERDHFKNLAERAK